MPAPALTSTSGTNIVAIPGPAASPSAAVVLTPSIAAAPVTVPTADTIQSSLTDHNTNKVEQKQAPVSAQTLVDDTSGVSNETCGIAVQFGSSAVTASNKDSAAPSKSIEDTDSLKSSSTPNVAKPQNFPTQSQITGTTHSNNAANSAPESRRPSAILVGELSEDAQRLNSELQSVFLDSRRESSASVISVPASLHGGQNTLSEEECNSNSSTHTSSHASTLGLSTKSKPAANKLQVLMILR